MTVDPFRCRCHLPCTQRATQEDMRCDTCRGDHMHMGAPRPIDDVWINPTTPVALAEPVRITFHD